MSYWGSSAPISQLLCLRPGVIPSHHTHIIQSILGCGPHVLFITAELSARFSGASDLHRAKALDTLATIELKFTLLRERVYIEKTEALMWEEALVRNGMFHTKYRVAFLC